LKVYYHRTLNVSIEKQKENKYNINNKKYKCKCLKLDGDIIKMKHWKIPFAVQDGIYYNRKKHRKII